MLERQRCHKRLLKDNRPFLAVDGEGAGRDEHQRQHYLLLQAGERTLSTGKPLTTMECLEFLLDLPPKEDAICVGFSIGYDISMMLRDLPGEPTGKTGWDGKPVPSRREHLLAPKTAKTWNNYTYWKGYGINYLPKNFIRVCRAENIPGNDRKQRPIEGSSRTIWETFGFFQKSFMNAVREFGIGTPDEHAMLEDGKAGRGEFEYVPGVGVSETVKRYCALECGYLARMMEDFRTHCLQAGIRPESWNGAAKLSRYLHKSNATMTREELEASLPADLLHLAQSAYYGGRFEVMRVGWVRGSAILPGGNRAPVYEYDINSAYPSAMRALPCLRHGRWRQVTGRELGKLLDDPEALFVAPVAFTHTVPARHPNLCGLPIRTDKGRLLWPAMGNGVYWSTELRAAARLGMKVRKFGEGWAYEKQCDCVQFDWVQKLYDRRVALKDPQTGKDTKAGYPLKLALNALYGLLAQRVGSGKFRNFIWAGLITAATRSALLDAAALDPEAVAMLATDAVITTRPLPGLDLRPNVLGAWEEKTHNDGLFIVQPGLYWGPQPLKRKRTMKTRGAAPRFFVPMTEQFERQWRQYGEAARAALHPLYEDNAQDWRKPPSVDLPIDLFVGMKIAQARGTPLTAGCWVSQTRKISFRWDAKREVAADWETDDCVWTYPQPGALDLESHRYDPKARKMDELEELIRGFGEEQPDFVEVSPEGREIPIDQ